MFIRERESALTYTLIDTLERKENKRKENKTKEKKRNQKQNKTFVIWLGQSLSNKEEQKKKKEINKETKKETKKGSTEQIV